MDYIDILGVKVNKVTLDEAVEVVSGWLGGEGKHYITTPNIEHIMLAQKDSDFKKVLNASDLAIPDSSRFNWVNKELLEQNIIKRIIYWPLFLMPSVQTLPKFPTTTGVDLMEALLRVSEEKGFTVGLIGGKQNLAERLSERLKHKYPKLNIVFTDSSIEVNDDGEIVAWGPASSVSRRASSLTSFAAATRQDPSSLSPLADVNLDILFVAFGAPKQEKWIAHNLQRSNVKVMMGVGGAFDYLSGDIKRAPKFMRQLGFEWLFRLLSQPWRIKRFLSLLRFVFIVLAYRKT